MLEQWSPDDGLVYDSRDGGWRKVSGSPEVPDIILDEAFNHLMPQSLLI